MLISCVITMLNRTTTQSKTDERQPISCDKHHRLCAILHRKTQTKSNCGTSVCPSTGQLLTCSHAFSIKMASSGSIRSIYAPSIGVWLASYACAMFVAAFTIQRYTRYVFLYQQKVTGREGGGRVAIVAKCVRFQ